MDMVRSFIRNYYYRLDCLDDYLRIFKRRLHQTVSGTMTICLKEKNDASKLASITTPYLTSPDHAVPNPARPDQTLLIP